VDLLVGYGNCARRDDALGWELAKSLAQGLSRVDLRLTQQLGPELAAELGAYRRVLLADASAGGPPVLLRRLRSHAKGAVQATSHHTGPEVLLSLAESLFGARCELWVLTVRGESMEFGEGLSLAARQGLKAALKLARPLIEDAHA
jgi:hydrogenase maturation protease